METLKQILMRRDHLTAAEADERIDEAKEELTYRLLDPVGCGPAEEICADLFGLEPDYLDELL